MGIFHLFVARSRIFQQGRLFTALFFPEPRTYVRPLLQTPTPWLHLPPPPCATLSPLSLTIRYITVGLKHTDTRREHGCITAHRSWVKAQAPEPKCRSPTTLAPHSRSLSIWRASGDEYSAPLVPTGPRSRHARDASPQLTTSIDQRRGASNRSLFPRAGGGVPSRRLPLRP